MFICQNSEGVHPYLLKCCRGTCSFVGMLKGYMVRKRLGTPVLKHVAQSTNKQIVGGPPLYNFNATTVIHPQSRNTNK